MKARFTRLAELLRGESEELRRLVDRAMEAERRAERSHDDLYWDSVALNLHGFYAGLERLFERVARLIDGGLPTGADRHRKLLEQMAQEVALVRPAVISPETLDRLDPYRSLRHLVRHTYPFALETARLRTLLEGASLVLLRALPELAAFANFLERSDPDRDPGTDAGKA